MCKKCDPGLSEWPNSKKRTTFTFGQNHIVFCLQQHELVHTRFGMKHKCKASAQAPQPNLEFLRCPSEI